MSALSSFKTLRQLASPSIRSFHATPTPFLPLAKKSPVPIRAPSRPASSAAVPPVQNQSPVPVSFDDIEFDSPPPVPARSPARAVAVSGVSKGTVGIGAEGTGLDAVVPSPPMTSFPNDNYKPIPIAAGIPGEIGTRDWTTSFSGLSQVPFDKETIRILMAPLKPDDIECKPDGLLYLPEIKYRRTLNLAFGPGAWGLAPRGETHVTGKSVSREWGLICLGRLVSIARGEQDYFDEIGVPTATEGCKSNALMRCSKDLGIASELWDPVFLRDYRNKYCVEVYTEHQVNKRKKKLWRKKDAPKFDYPWKEGK